MTRLLTTAHKKECCAFGVTPASILYCADSGPEAERFSGGGTPRLSAFLGTPDCCGDVMSEEPFPTGVFLRLLPQPTCPRGMPCCDPTMIRPSVADVLDIDPCETIANSTPNRDAETIPQTFPFSTLRDSRFFANRDRSFWPFHKRMIGERVSGLRGRHAWCCPRTSLSQRLLNLVRVNSDPNDGGSYEQGLSREDHTRCWRVGNLG